MVRYRQRPAACASEAEPLQVLPLTLKVSETVRLEYVMGFEKRDELRKAYFTHDLNGVIAVIDSIDANGAR